MYKKNRKIILGGGLLSVFIVTLIITVITLSNINPTVFIEEIKPRSYFLVPLGDPPADNITGLNYVLIIPNTADAHTDNYTGVFYENSSDLNAEMDNTTPHTTSVNILYQIQINYSHGWNASASSWDADYFYFRIQSTDLGIATYTNLTEAIVWSNTSTCTVNYWHNFSGSGYSLGHNEKINMSEQLWVFA